MKIPLRLPQPLITTLVLAFALCPTGAAQGFHGGPGEGRADDHYAGHRGLELEHNLVLPQLAVGRDVSTRLILVNLGNPQRMHWLAVRDLETKGTVFFFSQSGDPLPVRVNGGSESSEYAFQLGPRGSAVLDVTAEGPSTAGWALISVDDPEGGVDWGMTGPDSVMRGRRLSATAFYTIFDGAGQAVSQVGVTPAEYEREHFSTSTMAALFGAGANTGVAVVNTSDQTVSVNAGLYDPAGHAVAAQALSLLPGHQMALFVDQLFEGAVPEAFQGYLEFSTDDEGVVTLGLLMSGSILTSFPTHHFGPWRSTGPMMP